MATTDGCGDDEMAVTNTSGPTVDAQLMAEIGDYRNGIIDFFVATYGQQFDRRFRPVADKMVNNEDKCQRFAAIREQHMRQCEAYFERCLDKELRRLLTNQSIADKMAYIVDQRVDIEPDGGIQEALRPVKQQSVDRLKTFEQTLTDRLAAKRKQLDELTESVTKSLADYEVSRKSLQKIVLKMNTELESIDAKITDPLE